MTSSSGKKLQKELKQQVLHDLCFRLHVEAKKNNNKIPYGMVNKIVRESQEQFPFVTRSVIHKHYNKYVTGNFVSRLAQIKSHPIRNDESKEIPPSAGKEPSSSKSPFGEKVTVHPSFVLPDANDIAHVLIGLSSSSISSISSSSTTSTPGTTPPSQAASISSDITSTSSNSSSPVTNSSPAASKHKGGRPEGTTNKK